MKDKEYLELAEKVGLTGAAIGLGMTDYGDATQEIIDLCKQVAAHAKAEMRERCAKVCESELAMEVVNASRDYNEGRQMGATVCAQVIRALKD